MVDEVIPVRKIAAIRLSLTGAIVAGVFYALCWVGALILPIGPASHMYLELFTSADPLSGMALAQGLLWSVVFGLLIGALAALVYNLLSPLERR